MKKSELKALIREAIEDVKMEAKVKSSTGKLYDYDELNELMWQGKIHVFIRTKRGKLVELYFGQGFGYMDKKDGTRALHAQDDEDGLYEYGVDFTEVYVAHKANVK